MKTRIALFQGINVGGNHVLPMAELRSLLEELGCAKVRTYIQSGNVVFEGGESDDAALAEAICSAVKKTRGFAPRVFLLDRRKLEQALASNPYPEGEVEPKSLHLFFLETERGDAKFDRESVEPWRKENERFELIRSVLYLHAPDGIGRSKLPEKLGRMIGVPMTARNWRTATKLLELACAD